MLTPQFSNVYTTFNSSYFKSYFWCKEEKDLLRRNFRNTHTHTIISAYVHK